MWTKYDHISAGGSPSRTVSENVYKRLNQTFKNHTLYSMRLHIVPTSLTKLYIVPSACHAVTVMRAMQPSQFANYKKRIVLYNMITYKSATNCLAYDKAKYHWPITPNLRS